MASGNKTIARGFASVSLVILLFVYGFIMLFSLVDLMGRDVSMVDTTLVFGTSIYYVVLLGVQAVLIVTFTLGAHFDAVYSRGQDKAMFFYPRYMWDAWTFFAVAILVFGIQSGFLIAFMAQMGWNTPVNINDATFTSAKVIRFRTNTIFLVISCFVMLWETLTMITAYIIQGYELAPAATMTELIKERYGDK